MAEHPPARRHRVAVAGTEHSFEAAEGESILGAARRAGVWLPYECGWGGCGICKAGVVDGTTELLFPQAPAVDPRDARRGRVLLCQSTPRTDVVLKAPRVADSPEQERPTRDHRARLVGREELGPGIARFRFLLDDPAVYRPGQHAVLALAPGLRRCYSMAGLPGSAEVAFIAKRYPGRQGSEQLFALREGQCLAIELPYGDMWLRDTGRPVALLAGGTGLSAILAMIEELAARAELARAGSVPGTRPVPAVEVYYGAGRREDLVCWDELEHAVSRIPGARLHGSLVAPDADWLGTVGFVTDALAARLPALAGCDFYLAGPPPMTDAVRAMLATFEIQLDRIHYDSFG